MYSSPQFIHRTSALINPYIPRDDHSPSMCRECSMYRENSWNIPSDYTPSVSRECSVYIPERSRFVPERSCSPDASSHHTLTYDTEQNNNYASTPVCVSRDFSDNNNVLAFFSKNNNACIQEPIYHECASDQIKHPEFKTFNKFPPIWEENFGEI